MKKLKVLLLSSLDIELNNPFFRLGAYEKYLLPLAVQLEKSGRFECRFLIRDHLFDKLADKNVIFSHKPFIVSSQMLAENNMEGFMTQTYKGISKDQQSKWKRSLLELFEGYTPDVILIWEAPSVLFRDLFDDATVLDLMPGFMSRPPYPKMISIDPEGLYKDCWYSRVEAVDAISLERPTLLSDLRSKYQSFFDELNCHFLLWNHYQIPQNRKVALVPLQVTNYFGFYLNCGFQNQYEFLSQVCKTLETDGIIATQYTGNFVSDIALTDENIKYLSDYVRKVYYKEDLNQIDSISQFIIPFVDKVVSVSSTLGLQAAFYGKKLQSPSCSHLRYFNEKNSEKIISAILERGQFFFEKAVSNPDYIKNIILDIVEKRSQGKRGFASLPSASILQTTFDNYLELSNFKAASRSFSKVFAINPDIGGSDYLEVFKRSIKAKSVEVVSFDVFDTLLRRDVGDPKDIFMLMQQNTLVLSELGLPPKVINNFAKLRVLAERMLRSERDQQLEKGNKGVKEEIFIEEIYSKMALITGCDLPIKSLIDLEEKVELTHLKSRKSGLILFKYAKKQNKKIIIVSDFVHSSEFVKKALFQCGYTGIYKFFVSSETGVKKHSGLMFQYVMNHLGIKPGQILHIGDNQIGDVVKPRGLGIRAMKLISNAELLKKAFLNSGRDFNLFRSSASARWIFSHFAETFFKLESQRNSSNKFELVSSLQELGYLLLGPMMYGFAKWIVNHAKAEGVRQIVFFARDCKLAYLAAERIISKNNLKIRCVYLPVSRKSSTGIEIFTPTDVFSVRIDDFSKQKTLKNLLQERFLFSDSDPDSNLGGILTEELEKKICDIPIESQYQYIYEVVLKNWKILSQKYEDKRNCYAKYITNLGINLQEITIGVDVGYKGSIHRKLSPIFGKGLLPYFFMTYGNGYGGAPIDNAKVYYRENLFSFSKGDTFVSRNLLFETLINESKGTAINIYKDSKDEIKVSFDDSLPPEHEMTVNMLHKGAELFFDDAIKEGLSFRIEKELISYLFSQFVSSPTQTELEMLKYLVFDNSFSGARNTRFVSTEDKPDEKAKYLWPEANLKRAGAKSVVIKNQTTLNQEIEQNPTKVCGYRSRWLHQVIDSVVKKFSSPNKYRKFCNNPRIYFQDSQNPFIKKLSIFYKDAY